MGNYEIKILHLYPDLLNLYGDKGNIECLKKRLLWRGIDVTVLECCDENPEINLNDADIVFLGGGSDREQEIVLGRLMKFKEQFKAFVENGGSFIALCGGFELICRYIIDEGKKIEGLGLIDTSCRIDENKNRLIGNVVLECEFTDSKIVGFENHAGRIDIGNYTPLGKVKIGFGNDTDKEKEGVIYKNLVASYLHGPLFPKNPELCDKILENTLKHKYGDFDTLVALDDALEIQAKEYMLSRLCK